MSAQATEFQAFTLDLGGARIAGQRAGAGPGMVLVHSLLADSSSFLPVAQRLAQSHDVVLLDLPGFGLSDPIDGGIEAMADRLAETVRALGLTEAPTLLGNGYGGFITLLCYIRHPGIARKLILADCGAVFSEPGRAAFRGMSANAREKGLAAISDVAMRRLFSPEFQALHPELIAERRARFLQTDLGTFHRACASLATLDLSASLPLVDVPAWVLAGALDEATPPAMSEALAAGLPRAQLKILPGCAHVPQLQAPEQFMQAIAQALSA